MSKNSESSRPNIGATIAREVKARLDLRANAQGSRGKSAIVEAAIIFYLDYLEGAETTAEDTSEAAQYLSDHKEVYIENAIQTRQQLELIGGRMLEVADTVQNLFGVPFSWRTSNPPTIEESNDAKREALNAYSDGKSIYESVKAHVNGSVVALRDDANKVSTETRFDHIRMLLLRMPFMEDPRYELKSGVGLTICDTKFLSPPKREGDLREEPFEIISIYLDAKEPQLFVAKERPYFNLHPFKDKRARIAVNGIEDVMKLIPVIIHDYEAYRRFQPEA